MPCIDKLNHDGEVLSSHPGAVIAWSRALGEFGVTLLLAGATRMRTETLPMAIYLNLATGDMDLAIACAVILLLLAALMLLFIRLLAKRCR